jgi:uncharacterized protein (TIGR03437 family)
MLFYVSAALPLGPATFTIGTASGQQVSATVNIMAVAPGIFSGGVRQVGNTLEIYCTGLGPVQPLGSLQVTQLTPTVFIGAVPVQPLFSGLAPGYQGLYQIDVPLPTGIAAGLQSLLLSVDNAHSNSVAITVQ